MLKVWVVFTFDDLKKNTHGLKMYYFLIQYFKFIKPRQLTN